METEINIPRYDIEDPFEETLDEYGVRLFLCKNNERVESPDGIWVKMSDVEKFVEQLEDRIPEIKLKKELKKRDEEKELLMKELKEIRNKVVILEHRTSR